MIGARGHLSGCILALVVARMSDLLVATSGTAVPACRFAHAGYLLALAAWIGLAVPVLAQENLAQEKLAQVPAQVLAQDNAGLAAGKDAWARASCFTCHGSRAQGGDGGDYPVGPSLRNVRFGKETMVDIVSCGIPGTPPMPAWLKGAYTTVECYGMPLGSIPAGMTVPGILTADEIKALVNYVFATFVQAPRP